MNLQRVVLGLGLQESAAAMTLATELARSMRLQLLGLFVEDIDLLHFAGLPFAREVCLSSATSRQLDPNAMARALQQRAGEARRSLHRRLEGQSIQWTFEIVRGPVMPMLLGKALETDLLVAALPARATRGAAQDIATPLSQVRAARAPLLLVRDGPARRAPVVVLGSPDASAQAVAAPVSALARQFGSPVVFLMVGEPGAGGEGERWEARVASQLAADGVPVEFRHLPGDGDRLHEQLVRIRPGLVAVAGAQALNEAATLGLETLNCTLLLLPS